MKNFRERGYDNLEKGFFPCAGLYDIPILKPDTLDKNTPFIGFNLATNCENSDKMAVHFFLEDYMFERVWLQCGNQTEMLLKYKCVCSPDFSLYTDYPVAMQIWNHYRKHWLGAYWQSLGMRVLPTIAWSDKRSYGWCFDGEPVCSDVVVSSVGTQQDSQSRNLFLAGYEQMMDRLKPNRVFFYGNVPKECAGNIVMIVPFMERLHQLGKLS